MIPAMTVRATKPMPGDRSPLPHFAGRVEEMAELGERLEDVLLGNTTGGIQLITGVPGAGKSQLGRMFAETARERGNIRCEWVNVATVGRDVDLLLTIAEALDRDEEGREVVELNAKLTGVAVGDHPCEGQAPRAPRLRALGSNGQATLDTPQHMSTFPRLLAALKRAIQKKGTWRDGEALVLLIDELQTIRPQAMANLHTLHLGDHGCPIMVVRMGLQHTQAVLAHPADGNPGISRTSPPIVLGSLSADEAREAIRENVAAIAGETLPDDCVAKLAAASHGFPQHIHAYVRGAVEVVRKLGHCGEGPPLEEALRRGEARRSDYYLDRLASMGMNDPIGAMAHIVAALDKRGVDAMLIDDAIAAFTDTKHDGQAVVEEAVARGVLARQRDGTVGFGIPSFQAFLQAKLRERDVRAPAPSTV